jgi:hypothetical protein
MATYYVKIDSYWQDSPDRFFGPFTSRTEAEAAMHADIVRPDQHPADVVSALRGRVVTASESRDRRNEENTFRGDLLATVHNVADLRELEETWTS